MSNKTLTLQPGIYPENIIELCRESELGMIMLSSAKAEKVSPMFRASATSPAVLMPNLTHGIKGDDTISAYKHDICQFLNFSYDNRTGKGNVDAIASLLNVSPKIEMKGQIVDIKNGKYIIDLPNPVKTENKAFLEYDTNFEILQYTAAKVATQDIAAIVVTSWMEDGTEHLMFCMHETYSADEHISYTHSYPKKETIPLKIDILSSISKNSSKLNIVTSGTIKTIADAQPSNHVVISFNDSIYRTYNLDYLCKVKTSAKGNPYFAVPSRGILSYHGGTVILDKTVAKCLVTQVNGGGGVAKVYNVNYDKNVFSTDGENLLYEMFMTWCQEYIGPTNPTDIRAEHMYKLELTAYFKTPAGHEIKTTLIVSSEECQYGDNQLAIRVPRLIFTWDCIAHDMPITLKDGTVKLVQDLAAGDIVLSRDGFATVKESVKFAHSDNIVRISAGGQFVAVSCDHPVITSGGVKEASKLTVSDEVLSQYNSFAKVDAVVTAAYDGDVYSITLDGGDILFANGIAIGDSGIRE